MKLAPLFYISHISFFTSLDHLSTGTLRKYHENRGQDGTSVSREGERARPITEKYQRC